MLVHFHSHSSHLYLELFVTIFKNEACFSLEEIFVPYFYARKQLCFQRVLAIGILSVCLFVCPSHGWISQKRSKLGSPNLAQKTLVSGTIKLLHKFDGGHSEQGH